MRNGASCLLCAWHGWGCASAHSYTCRGHHLRLQPHRNVHKCARSHIPETSSGCAKRPSGVRLRSRSVSSGSLRFWVCDAVRCGAAAGCACVAPTGCNRRRSSQAAGSQAGAQHIHTHTHTHGPCLFAQLSQSDPWCDRVDPNALWRPLHSQAGGQLIECCLAGSVQAATAPRQWAASD